MERLRKLDTQNYVPFPFTSPLKKETKLEGRGTVPFVKKLFYKSKPMKLQETFYISPAG